MSEFEKWWSIFNCNTVDCANLNCYSCKIIRKETWKTALEWIYNIAKEIDIKDLDITPYDVINEELKNLNQSDGQSDNST